MRYASCTIAFLVATSAALACADRPEISPLRVDPARPHGADAASDARSEVRAPIVRVALRIAESFPPRYFADVTVSLPDGCTQLARGEVWEPRGDTIVISVFNERMAPPEAACTQVYREQEVTFQLRGRLVSGKTYTLDVNGTLETFVAQ